MIAVLLVVIALALAAGHPAGTVSGGAALQGSALWIAGAVAGVLIGGVASLLGVAGGELLISTLVMLFGIDLKLAGSMSLAISLPTMLVGMSRYSRDRSFSVLRTHRRFVVAMAAGSVVGAGLGARALGSVPTTLLLPLLVAVLLVSAIKTWHGASKPSER